MTRNSLSPSTVISEPWKRSRNQTKICATEILSRNLLIQMHYLNALPKVILCPTNVNGNAASFRKTLMSSDPVLLILPVLHMSNTILILTTLNPSNRGRIAPAITIVRKLKIRWRRWYKIASLNPVLVPAPALLY